MLKIKLLQPDLVLGDTVLALTQEMLDQYKIKGLILDVDETLVPLKKSFVSEELRHLILHYLHKLILKQLSKLLPN